MIEFAEHWFSVRQVRADGATEQDHNESAAAQWAKLGKTVKPKTDPDAPEFPDALSYLWEYFIEILSAVTYDDCGGPQVTWGVIQSWSELMGVTLEKWEMIALTTLGRVGQSVAAKAFTDRMKK